MTCQHKIVFYHTSTSDVSNLVGNQEEVKSNSTCLALYYGINWLCTTGTRAFLLLVLSIVSTIPWWRQRWSHIHCSIGTIRITTRVKWDQFVVIIFISIIGFIIIIIITFIILLIRLLLLLGGCPLCWPLWLPGLSNIGLTLTEFTLVRPWDNPEYDGGSRRNVIHHHCHHQHHQWRLMSWFYCWLM